MATYAAVVTGKGVGAIATVQVYGPQAAEVVARCLAGSAAGQVENKPGLVRLGAIMDQGQAIDQVLVACEDRNLWAIHCHGNPMITKAIMDLVCRHGTIPVEPEALLARYYRDKGQDTIQIEARLALTQAKGLRAAALVASQGGAGLRQLLLSWLGLPPGQVRNQVRRVIQRSRAAMRLIHGCSVALVGPTNTGKSLLFNRLLGQDKAIVSQAPFTTRDPIRATCQIGPLQVEMVDTAALWPQSDAPLQIAAADLTRQVIQTADLVILVLDPSSSQCLFEAAGLPRPGLTVLNKADLAWPADISDGLEAVLAVSARTGEGLAGLRRAILAWSGVSRIRPDRPVAFTDRQRLLLERLSGLPDDDTTQAQALLEQLLHGQIEPDD